MSRARPTSADSGRPQAEPIGTRLWSCLFIAGLFLSVSLLSSSIPGVNEPHYLTKSRSFDNPDWCSRDFFLTSTNAHYCFFWLTGILTRWLSLDSVAPIGRVVSSLLLAIGWSMLGRSIGLTSLFRIVGAGLFASISLLGSFSGEWLLGGFESKVPAWGLALMAISLWIRGQLQTCPGWMTVAGVTCGLACFFHPVVGGWVAACICFASVSLSVVTFQQTKRQISLCEKARTESGRFSSEISEPRLLKSMFGLACFSFSTIILSLPGLVPALRLVMDKSLPLKDRELASFYQVFWRLKHHLDPTELLASQWTYAFLVSGGVLLCVSQLRQSERRRSEARPLGSEAESRAMDALRCLLVVFAFSAAIAFGGVLIGWHTVAAQKMNGWEWRASLLKFYPFRCFDALLPIMAALVLARCIQVWRLLITHVRSGVRILIAIAIIAAPLVQASTAREAAPAGYTVEQFEDWKDACQWLRLNTPPHALILTPRESFAFKWFAERAEFVCYKDCPQDAAGILTWNKRLWLLHDWTLKSSTDGQYGNDDLQNFRRLTNCDYIVTRILGPFESPPIWEGREWKIYTVP